MCVLNFFSVSLSWVLVNVADFLLYSLKWRILKFSLGFLFLWMERRRKLCVFFQLIVIWVWLGVDGWIVWLTGWLIEDLDQVVSTSFAMPCLSTMWLLTLISSDLCSLMLPSPLLTWCSVCFWWTLWLCELNYAVLWAMLYFRNSETKDGNLFV